MELMDETLVVGSVISLIVIFQMSLRKANKCHIKPIIVWNVQTMLADVFELSFFVSIS